MIAVQRWADSEESRSPNLFFVMKETFACKTHYFDISCAQSNGDLFFPFSFMVLESREGWFKTWLKLFPFAQQFFFAKAFFFAKKRWKGGTNFLNWGVFNSYEGRTWVEEPELISKSLRKCLKSAKYIFLQNGIFFVKSLFFSKKIPREWPPNHLPIKKFNTAENYKNLFQDHALWKIRTKTIFLSDNWISRLDI